MQDIGPAGPDKGKGGKYLVLPPAYAGGVLRLQNDDRVNAAEHAKRTLTPPAKLRSDSFAKSG